MSSEVYLQNVGKSRHKLVVFKACQPKNDNMNKTKYNNKSYIDEANRSRKYSNLNIDNDHLEFKSRSLAKLQDQSKMKIEPCSQPLSFIGRIKRRQRVVTEGHTNANADETDSKQHNFPSKSLSIRNRKVETPKFQQRKFNFLSPLVKNESKNQGL